MDLQGAFEFTRLVEAVLHLKTGNIGPQENYTADNFVFRVLKGQMTTHIVELCWEGQGDLTILGGEGEGSISQYTPAADELLGSWVYRCLTF